MKKEALSKLLIKDLPYYNRYSSYCTLFTKNGVTTVDQLFDKKLMLPLINKSSVKKETKNEIEGLIILAGADFFHLPVPTDELLDKKIVSYKKISDDNYRFYLKMNDKETLAITLDDLSNDILFGSKHHTNAYELRRVVDKDEYIREQLVSSKLRVVDFINLAINSESYTRDMRCSGIKLTAAMYKVIIKSYAYNHGEKTPIAINPKVTEMLKTQLVKIEKRIAPLEMKRNRLIKQIEELEELSKSAQKKKVGK